MRAISNDKANNLSSVLRSKKSNSKVAKQVGVSRATAQNYHSSLKMSKNVDERVHNSN
jgi:response regulator of citrate/malate metabolism